VLATGEKRASSAGRRLSPKARGVEVIEEATIAITGNV